ncbi:hypothetical protein [Azospirillum agricola]|uniref:hypothetical protein n=1 Tax=Azospirillum agricola TaxID=1720247 RepID=UPI000A0EF5A4|nr:hypothetical protein [Azospirillum agricola]SMH31983.1 hypothetical protein SAMN02982994_0539 [Azospirillum lipoferum]
MTDALLTYQTSFLPETLQVNQSGSVIINPRQGATPCWCRALTFIVKTAPDPDYLFLASPGPTVEYNNRNWVPSEEKVVAAADYGLGVGDAKYFKFHCEDEEHQQITYDLEFTITGHTTSEVTTSTIVVIEESGTSPSSFTEKETDLPVPVTTLSLFLRNFMATADGKPGVPCTQFNRGDKIVLSWESSGTHFTLYSDKTGEIWSGGDKGRSIDAGLAADTTLVLAASLPMVGEDAEADGDLGLGLGSKLYASLTVTIADPAILTPHELKVAGPSTLTGALNVSGATTLTAAPPAAALTVASGQTALKDTTVTGALGVTGNLDVAGNLAVTGTVNATGALTAQSSLAVSGALSAVGPVAILGERLSLTERLGIYAATTDGYVIGNIQCSGNFPTRAQLGWIWASSGDQTVTATGGSTVFCFVPNGRQLWMGSNNQSLNLPVRKGERFTIGFAMETETSVVKPTYSFFWIPFGTGRPDWVGEAPAPSIPTKSGVFPI